MVKSNLTKSQYDIAAWMDHAEKQIEAGNFTRAATSLLDVLEIYAVSKGEILGLDDWDEIMNLQITLRKLKLETHPNSLDVLHSIMSRFNEVRIY